MLTRQTNAPAGGVVPRRQAGVVLMMALIVLVAMTLAGIALVRSVDTSNVIAGNLAFQQAATHSADAGTEAAVQWLIANNSTTALYGNLPGQGYAAVRADPVAPQSWDTYWQTVLVPNGYVVTLPADAAGNSVAYTIQRLCLQPLPPHAAGAGCEFTTATFDVGTSSKTAGTVALQSIAQVYYRISMRIAGPRNTVSYVQTIVAL